MARIYRSSVLLRAPTVTKMIAINYESPRGVLCSNMMYDVSPEVTCSSRVINGWMLDWGKNTARNCSRIDSVISRVKKDKTWRFTVPVVSTRILKANFFEEVSLFVRNEERACIVFLEHEFPRYRPFYHAVFVSAQRRKLDRMNYHETWRIIRAWKPPLNEEKPCGGVTTVSDNNNVSLKTENEGGENGCRPFPAIFPFLVSAPFLTTLI